MLRAISAPTFRSLLRASRSGLVIPKYARVQQHAVRWQSTQPAVAPAPPPAEEFEEELESEQEVVKSEEPKRKGFAPEEFEAPIDPSKVRKPKHAAIEADQPEFSTLKGKISHDTLKAITVKPMKLTHMSPVQAAVLPLLPGLAVPYDPDVPEPELEPGQTRPPRDLLVKARTGTGKTLAFLVPAIEARLKSIEQNAKRAVKEAGLVSDKHLEGRATRTFTRTNVGALIISPTRELATQIATEACKLTEHHKDFGVQLFVGGNAKRRQMREFMTTRRDIVVATPGRLRDLLDSEPAVLEGVSKARMLILDEADTLLDMGFREDIQQIAKILPKSPERQTFLFSATVSHEIQLVARATMDKNHQFINCVSDNAPPVHAHVPQYHTVLPSAAHQIPHILRLLIHDQLTNPGKSKVIVFLPTTKMTQLFSTFLRVLSKTCLPSGLGSRVYEIHSLRTQESRTRTSSQFRADRSGGSILVSSDVSARGVDYPGVTRIIQIGVPSSSDQYVHRVGRTGRGAQGSGRADLVLLPWEVGFVTWQLTNIPMKPLTVSELTTQVDTLIKDYDDHPLAYSSPGARESREKLHPFAPALQSMEEEIKTLLASIDEHAIRETLGAALGYYVGRAHELRIQKPILVQGLKDWTVEACGLPTPPYISDAFLQKIGISDGRTGNNYRGGPIKKPMKPRTAADTRMPWVGRGNVKARLRSQEEGNSFGRERKEREPREQREWDGERRSSRWEDRDGEERRPRYGSTFDGGEREQRRPRYDSDSEGGERERRPRFDGEEGRGSFERENKFGGRRLESRFGDREDGFDRGKRSRGFGVKNEDGNDDYHARHFESRHKSFR